MAFFSAFTLWIAILLGGPQDTDWGSLWTQLASLEATEPDAQGSLELWDQLAQAATHTPAGTRRQVLEAHLAAWKGQPHDLDPAQVSATGLDGHESWLLAAVLPTSPPKAQSVLQALAQTPTLDRDQLDMAWRTAAAEAGALRLAEGARPIQEILHARYQAAWTATHLCLTLMRLGELGELDRMMRAAIEREEAGGRSSAELWSQWGLAVLGAGQEHRARNLLGRALERGSQNAALILGRLDLQLGRLAAARANFRSSVLTEKPSAWALRGWGSSLLPKAQTNPKSN